LEEDCAEIPQAWRSVPPALRFDEGRSPFLEAAVQRLGVAPFWVATRT